MQPDERGDEIGRPIFLFWSDYGDPLKPQARIAGTNEFLAIYAVDIAIDVVCYRQSVYPPSPFITVYNHLSTNLPGTEAERLGELG